MELSQSEKEELQYLVEKKASITKPMHQYQLDRLDFLKRRSIRNHCINPHCTGFYGSENDDKCPKCGNDLYKDSLLSATVIGSEYTSGSEARQPEKVLNWYKDKLKEFKQSHYGTK